MTTPLRPAGLHPLTAKERLLISRNDVRRAVFELNLTPVGALAGD